MGISQNTANQLESLVNYKLGGKRIGDQVLVPWDPKWYSPNHRRALNYFKSFGNEYSCFDIHGMNGAVKVDFRKQLSEDFKRTHKFGTYDVATDYGTLEHVCDNNYESFCFLHELPKLGGIVHHVVPSINHLEAHADWFFDRRFFEKLISNC